MPIPASGIHAAVVNNVLRLILMPTEACNFRCSYCYEDFESGRMNVLVVRGVKRFLHRRADELELLTLSWFGGEPLLALDLITDIMQHARSLAASRPRLHVRADIATNGFLLDPATFTALLDLGMGTFQVALDGPAEAHDRTRVRIGGGGTFRRIWDHLGAMRSVARPFVVVVRLHVHGGNVSTLPAYLEMHARVFAGDARFRLLFKEISPLGGPAAAGFPYLDAGQCGATLAALRDRARALGIECVEPEPAEICYAARGNAFVVRADGRLGKCTVALGQAANEVGRIHADGRLQLDADAMHAWMRGLWTQDEAALACPMRGLATTGAVAGAAVFRVRGGAPVRKGVRSASSSRP